MKGSRPLLVAITLVWAVVWLLTQVVVSVPLQTAPTIAIGLGLTLFVVWGYQSSIRGPRRLRGLSASSGLGASVNDPLLLVNRTLPHLREGLTEDTAHRSADQLLPLTGGYSVRITDTERVLGSSTAAGRQGETGLDLPEISRNALKQGRAVHRRGASREVATPLRLDDRTIGTIAVTYDPGDRPPLERLEAVANLVGLHIEIAELTEKAQLAADAKLDALRAQINPHFLFNTLNTIASKSRTDPEDARRLLQRLADFFRYATQQEGQFAEFAHEYFFVRTYLSLEQARFDERLKVHYDIDPQVLAAQIPVLTIQPLVENAVKHGLAPKPGGGTVNLKARVDPLAGAIKIDVRDDGVGMDEHTLAEVAAGRFRSDQNGVGLRNIHERLERLYGSRYHLDIRSTVAKGTRIEMELPL